MFVYCLNNPVIRIDDGGNLSSVAIGAIVGGAIGLVSALVRGESVTGVLLAVGNGAATGALCAMGAVGVLVGSTLNGIMTGITAKGSTEEKVDRGGVAFGSTLFWGGYGYGLANLAGDGQTENIIFDLLFGSVAELVSQFSQEAAVRAITKPNTMSSTCAVSTSKMVLMER